MSWVALLKIVLGLALNISNIIREKRLLDAGAQAEVGRQLALLVQRTDTMDQVTKETEAMTDDELDAALRGDR